VLPGLVLVALIVLAAVSARTGLWGAAMLGAASILWLLVNGPAEGPVLWRVTHHHGVTVTDLAGLAGMAVAIWRACELWRQREAA
jgi:hypothetical protein